MHWEPLIGMASYLLNSISWLGILQLAANAVVVRHPRWLYTLRGHDGVTRNHIDYFLGPRKHATCLTECRSPIYPKNNDNSIARSSKATNEITHSDRVTHKHELGPHGRNPWRLQSGKLKPVSHLKLFAQMGLTYEPIKTIGHRLRYTPINGLGSQYLVILEVYPSLYWPRSRCLKFRIDFSRFRVAQSMVAVRYWLDSYFSQLLITPRPVHAVYLLIISLPLPALLLSHSEH